MRDGLVSVITPAYNCAQFIGKTIESVQAQTYDNWEMVIVDDSSTDNTREVVESYSKDDSRVRYICLKENSGAAVARTESMKAAEGEYMAFLDSDDMWKPEKLDKQLAFMREEGHPFSCTAYEQVDEQGNPLGKVIKTIRRTSYNRLLLDCPVGNSTVMYSVRAMGKFEVPNIRKRNDDALWLQMLKKEPYIWGMPEILAEYRVREGSISHNKFDLVKYHWKLYREIEHLGVLRSIFHVLIWGFIKVFKIK